MLMKVDYKKHCNTSTILFAVPFYNDPCRIGRMSTLGERVQEAVEKAKGQSELARLVSALMGKTVPPQNIQALLKSKSTTASRSGLAPYIAQAVGFSAVWMSTGKGPKYEGERLIGTKQESPSYGPEEDKPAHEGSNLFVPAPLIAAVQDLINAWKTSSVTRRQIHAYRQLIRADAQMPELPQLREKPSPITTKISQLKDLIQPEDDTSSSH